MRKSRGAATLRGMPKTPTPSPASERKGATDAQAQTSAPTAPIADFERSLDELETLVQRLEHGELSLDDSLSTFERGIALYCKCQGALEQAEMRVKLLLDPERPDRAADFETDTP